MIKYIKNLFKLPSPVELGMSEHNALGCREFTPFQEGPTWEDWNEIVKKKHPIKFWVVYTAPRKYWWPIEHRMQHVWYWLQCHVMPWKYNFYKINLAGIDKNHPEQYGYIDPCETLKLAAWYCLIRYVEDCRPVDVFKSLSEEEMKESWAKSQKADYDEAMFLYNWWTKDRFEEQKIIHEAYSKHNLLNYNTCSKDEYDEITKAWLNMTRAQDLKEEEMFLRVCKLRQILWN